MYLTPIEAQQKTCIHAHQVRLMSIALEMSSLELPSGDANCLADDCMHWRWGMQDKGYCGLSGRPQTNRGES